MTAVTPGVRVYTKDGKYLGEVSDLREGLFKLRAPLAVDYWLRDGDVEKVEHGSALMSFAESELRDRRIEAGASASSIG